MDQLYTFDSPSMTSHSPMINYRKDAKKGVKFTFMVVGEMGTGKTTFVNSLLNKKVMSHRYEVDNGQQYDTKTLAFTSAKSISLPNTAVLTRNDFNPSSANEEPGIALTETKVEMVDDDNMKLYLNIIDTPGFGENLNNEICFVEIENYLKQQFDLVLAEETRIRRNPRFVDTRVHVMLYFITATGHGLREIDINCMKRLSKYVNILPVISKADTFTETELRHFKQQIKIDIEKFNVPIFQFDNSLSEYDEEEDYELIQECKYLSSLQPFAIISSEDEYEITDPKTGESKTTKARQYPWGLVDINNPKYSDFGTLKSVLLGTHLQDFKDLTHDFLYETYRTERLSKVTGRLEDDEDDDREFHESYEEQPYEDSFLKDATTIPSLSNLAQLTSSNPLHGFGDDHSITSTSSSKANNKSMLLDGAEPSSGMPSPKLRDNASTSSRSTISLDNGHQTRNLNSNNAAFKRLSIAPQRNQLRQISETVPYVIRHERILERQQKLEEMEMASAKELSSRAALLEQKAAALKAKERLMMKKLETERLRHVGGDSSDAASQRSQQYHYDNEDDLNNSDANYSVIQKEETLTDLHSIVSQK